MLDSDRMIRTLLALSLALVSGLADAQTSGQTQYISDDISVTLRDAARNDAAPVGSISSGDRVTVLQVLGSQSFAQIRTVDGRVGWINARYLSPQPAAKVRIRDLQGELATAQTRVRDLESELATLKSRLEGARPAFQLQQENGRLQQALTLAEQERTAARARYDEESARRRTLVTGAGLVGGGVFLGLLLPWLGSGRRRRRSDF